MASEELKQFLIERLVDLDPNLTEDEGSTMFTKVIDPTLKRLGTDPLTVDVETFVMDRLAEEFPNLDVASPGSVLRDVLVTPLVLLLEPLRREINFLRLQNSVEDADTLSDVEMDALLSNMLVLRKEGDYARTIQRIYFSSPHNVKLDASITFSDAAGIAFVAETTKSYSAGDLKKSGNLFYLDASVRSLLASSEANVDRNTVRYVEGLEGVVRTYNLITASGGITTETNEQFQTRAENSLSERSLNTKRGIEAALFDMFPTLVSIDVVGFGEPEMTRDLLHGQTVLAYDEIVGPLVYVTNNFKSISVFNLHDAVSLPFTNTLVLHDVPDAKEAAVTAATYLRVFDANNYFDDLLLSRVREVESTVSVIGDSGAGFKNITIRTKDFTIYPQRSDITAEATAVPITTDGATQGFNKYARGGSAQKLLTYASLGEQVLGAPLPFTDCVDMPGLTDAPNEAELGKDFLLAVADNADSDYTTAAYTVTSGEQPTTFRVFPIDKWFAGGRVGITRVDGFMLDKAQSGYTGLANFTYSSEPGVSLLPKGINIIDCGCPAFDKPWAGAAAEPNPFADKFDGKTKNAWTKNAGVSAYAVQNTDPVTPIAGALNVGTEYALYVVLHPDTLSWADRGVKVGHFISLAAVLDSSTVTDVAGFVATAVFKWQGWGRIEAFSTTSEHEILVKGVDIDPLIVDLKSETGFNDDPTFFGQFEPEWVYLPAAKYTMVSVANVGTPTNLDSMTFTVDPALSPGFGAGPPALGSGLMGGVTIVDVTGGKSYVCDSAGIMYAPTGPTAIGTVDFTTGAVFLDFTLQPADIPLTANAAAFRYDYVNQDQYRLLWTVYEGEQDIVAPDGTLHTTYTDFVYPSAYKRYNAASGDVAHREPAGYRNTGYYANKRENWSDFKDATNNKMAGFWIRLGRSFNAEHTSIGAVPVTKILSSEVVNLESAITGTTAVQLTYLRTRYPQAKIAAALGEGSHKHILTMTSLPVQQGQTAITAPTTAPVFNVLPDPENIQQNSGFLIPYPFGPTYSGDQAEFVAGAPANLILTNQLVHLYDSAVPSSEPKGIQVTQIPGSTPFPNAFEETLEVDNNQIHIGGLSDIYLIGSSVDTTTSDAIKLGPESLTNTVEVIATGKDGKIVASSSFFESLGLEAALETEFATTAGIPQKACGNYVVELVHPPAVTPIAFRVLNNVADGAIIDGTFSAGPFNNVEWRLLKTCATSLENPLNMLQQGTTLKAAKNSNVVTVDPITFPQSPSTTVLYLSIDSGADQGEYRITHKFASTFQLDTYLTVTAEFLPYRVYSKQQALVQLPLVRVKEISLAGDNAGITVPYKHPIDAVASSFAGINNDPITDVSLSVEGTLLATLDPVRFQVLTQNFVSLGVLTYDVLRLDNQTGSLEYFYVTGFATSPGGTANDTLILDRALPATADILEVPFTLGHPSVGTATVYFKDPTYFEAGPDAVFSYTDDSAQVVSFRPSPAESTKAFRSEQTTTDISVASIDELLGDTTNFFLHGVAVGDTVDILSRNIRSTGFTAAAKAAINCANKTLMLRIDGSNYPVVFSGQDPKTLDGVAADINAAVGTYLRAAVVETVALTTWVLEIRSSSAVEILDEGSVGILTTLGWDVAAEQDNSPSALTKTFQVKTLTYDKTSTKVTMELEAVTGTAVTPDLINDVGAGKYTYIQVNKVKYQRLYPADLTKEATGIYKGTVTLTSYAPFTSDIVPVDKQLTVTGHEGFGYELVVDNDSYSYSQGEKVSVRVSPVILPATATSLTTAYALPGAEVTVEYDYSSLAQDVQSFMLSPESRVVNHNPLCRHFLPAYPVFDISYKGGLAAEVVKDKVGEFLKTLYPNDPLEVFDLTTILGFMGLSFVQYPQEVAFLAYDENRVMRLYRSKDTVDLGKKSHIMGDLDLVSIQKIG